MFGPFFRLQRRQHRQRLLSSFAFALRGNMSYSGVYCKARSGAWRACTLLRMDVFLLFDYTRGCGQDGVREEFRVVFVIAVDRHRQLPLTQGMHARQ